MSPDKGQVAGPGCSFILSDLQGVGSLNGSCEQAANPVLFQEVDLPI